MVRVRILAGIAGEGRSSGEVLDLPANEAQHLVALQRAELVRGADMETPEQAQRSRETTGRSKRSAPKQQG